MAVWKIIASGAPGARVVPDVGLDRPEVPSEFVTLTA
jgi:hypothetical protein